MSQQFNVAIKFVTLKQPNIFFSVVLSSNIALGGGQFSGISLRVTVLFLFL